MLGVLLLELGLNALTFLALHGLGEFFLAIPQALYLPLNEVLSH